MMLWVMAGDFINSILIHFIAGIYSDTHMLALMYCGEMCVWCSQYCGDDSCVRTQTDLGIRCLQTFCEMVSGPLKGKGWTATQAHSYLGKLKTLCSSLNE